MLPDPRLAEPTTDDLPIFSPRPRPRIDEWAFKDIVAESLPSVLAETEMSGLRLISDLLDRYVTLSRHDESAEGPEDYSFVWRPAIGNHSQNRNHDLDDVLVEAVRDDAQQLIQARPDLAQAIIQELESRPWYIFKRIALYIMRVNSNVLMDEITKRLSDRQLVDSPSLFHEFWTLAGEQFGNLTSTGRAALLSNIEAGPRTSYLARVDDPEHSTKVWKWRRLAMLGSDLPEPWKTEYENLQEELGPLEHPEFLAYTYGVTTGPNSPLSREALAEMNSNDVAEFLRTWEPSGGFRDPSPEGLGRELALVVATSPQRFAESAGKFADLQPTYVRGLIDGFRQACSNNIEFEWTSVLELCQWVISQGRGANTDGQNSLNQDVNWLPTRRSVANLLEEGFSSQSCEMPLSQRHVAWAVLKPLTEDPEPSRDDEIQEGLILGDPATASLNSVRGVAMHATVRYALWVMRNTDTKEAGGMENIPEAREVLRKGALRDSYG